MPFKAVVSKDPVKQVSGGCLLPAQCLSLLAQQVEAFYSAQLELHDTHCECVDAALTDILFASGSVGACLAVPQ